MLQPLRTRSPRGEWLETLVLLAGAVLADLVAHWLLDWLLQPSIRSLDGPLRTARRAMSVPVQPYAPEIR